MNTPVKVELKNLRGRMSTVMDDELHGLIHDGLVSFKDAVDALRKAGLQLNKKAYPWLREIESWADGSLNMEKQAKAPAESEVLKLPKAAPSKAETTNSKSEGAK